MNRRNWILIIGLSFISPIFSQETIKTNWNEDIEFLRKELPSKHINFFSKRNKKEFYAELDSIKSLQNDLTNFGFAIKLQQVISSFGDSHTSINWKQLVDKNKILPLLLYQFTDGIYILQTLKENQEFLGTKIIKINQIPIDVIVDSLKTLITLDNKAIVKSQMPKLIPYVQLLEYFKFVKNGKVILETEDSTGKVGMYEIQPGIMDSKNRVRCQMDSVAFCYLNEKEYFIDKYFDSEKAYYIQYNKCFSREIPPPYFKGNPKILPSFIDFGNKVIETINSKPINKLIVDFRFNSGGSSPQGTELIKRLSEIEKVNQKGKLYVILGRSTFSSAIINVMDFKKMTKAIFVGKETSGKPDHFGEIKSFKLPNSGLIVSYSTMYFRRTNNNPNTLTPDYTVEESFKGFTNGIDPVYEWIIKH